MTQRDPDELIRSWFQEGPSRSSGEGVEQTLARLAALPRPRRWEVRLPVWVPLAAVLSLVLVGVIAFGAGFRIVPPVPTHSPTATAPSPIAGNCRIGIPVHGRNSVLVGFDFAPDTDVVVTFDRPNQQRLTFDSTNMASLHTDRTGGFAMGWRPFPEDLGLGTITATAGCSVAIPVEVTAADLPTDCGDPAVDDSPVVDGALYRAAVAADQPLAWWGFDTAADMGADAIGSHSGSVVGNVIATPRSPLSDGGSAYFHHQFPDPTHVDVVPVDLVGDFSVEFWLWFCHWADGDAIVGAADTHVSVKIGEGEMHLFAGTDGVLWAGEAVVSGSWQHYVITRQGSTLTMYRNGVVDEQYPDTGWTDEFPISRLGGDFDSNYLGFLDETALYDHALTPERVAAHANP